MKKDFQPEQMPSSEPQPIVLPSATDSAKPNVICSQSVILDLSNIPLVDNPYFSNEYLKKRKESYKAVVKILVQDNPLP
jgi:hypothetical protein